MALTIEMDEKTRNWIHEKGDVVTVSRFDVRGCCVSMEDVEVKAKMPKKENLYLSYKQDGITIYVQKGMQFKNDKLEIAMNGMGVFRYLIADGLKR